MFLGCEVDHLISEKHGGPTTAGNLAYACVFCNRHKGSDIGSIVWRTGEYSRFFNPRADEWREHFALGDRFGIEPLTNVGEVTAAIPRFNEVERLIERRMLNEVGRYPSPQALGRMG